MNTEKKLAETVTEKAVNFPIPLTGERAWRTYIGGSLIDALHGKTDGEDGHFPEEWIVSLICARNVGREHIEEGKSRLADDPQVSLSEVIESNPAGYLGERHARKYGVSTGVLVKLIDAAERLTVQVHPDRSKAKELFNSQYGKTECWYILGGREVKGEKPCIYLGFREGVDRKQWTRLFEEQDIQGMLSCLHRFEVEPGDIVLIEGGVPHAIGAGCFLMEIQEPTDYTIRVERTTPAGFQVDDFMCHQGLGFQRMMECFQYNGYSKEETKSRWFVTPCLKKQEAGGRITSLIGKSSTEFFAMDLLEVTGSLKVALPADFSGLYVLSGRGQMCGGAESMGAAMALEQGQQFFIPAGTGELTLTCREGESALKAVLFFGPQ